MEQRRLRVLKGKGTSKEVFIINVPKKIAIFYKDVYFNIEKSGAGIVMASGCKSELSKEKIENYDYADCRI